VDGERPRGTVLTVGGRTRRPVEVDVVLVGVRLDEYVAGLDVVDVADGVRDDRPAIAEPVLAEFANVCFRVREDLVDDALVGEHREDTRVDTPALGFVERLGL